MVFQRCKHDSQVMRYANFSHVYILYYFTTFSFCEEIRVLWWIKQWWGAQVYVGTFVHISQTTLQQSWLCSHTMMTWTSRTWRWVATCTRDTLSLSLSLLYEPNSSEIDSAIYTLLNHGCYYSVICITVVVCVVLLLCVCSCVTICFFANYYKKF